MTEKTRERIGSGVRLAIGVILVLILLVGAGNLYATYDYVKQFKQDQQNAARSQIMHLCKDLGTMASIPPPAGPVASNPSRAYEQSEHTAWKGLYTSIKCP